MNKVRTNKL